MTEMQTDNSASHTAATALKVHITISQGFVQHFHIQSSITVTATSMLLLLHRAVKYVSCFYNEVVTIVSC